MSHARPDSNERGRGDRGLFRGSARSWARSLVLLASALGAAGCTLFEPASDPDDESEWDDDWNQTRCPAPGPPDSTVQSGIAADPRLRCADRSSPAPKCTDQELAVAAVQGRVLGVPDDAALQVSLWAPWTSDSRISSLATDQPCETDGLNYRCPGMGSRQEYMLEVTRDGEIIAQRDLYVRSDGCKRETLTYDVDPGVCELEVWLGTDASALSNTDVTVSVDASASEPSATCARVGDNRHLFRCPVSAGAAESHEVTVAVEGGAPIRKTASNEALAMCPAVHAWHVSEGAAPVYGVPVVVLNNAEVNALSLHDE